MFTHGATDRTWIWIWYGSVDTIVMTIGSYYYNPVTNDLSYEPLVILNLVTQISPLRKLARIIPNF